MATIETEQIKFHWGGTPQSHSLSINSVVPPFSRGHCLMAAGDVEKGFESHATAARLVPDCRIFQMILAHDEEEKRTATRAREITRIQEMEPRLRQLSPVEQIHLQNEPNPLKSRPEIPLSNVTP